MPLFRSVGACLLVGALTAWVGFSAHGQPTPAQETATGGRTWVSLTRVQQDALRPLQPEWQSIEPARKIKWIEIADRLPKLPPDERARVQERMAEWARLSPAQRGQARVNYRQVQQLPAEDRKARWEAYKALPPDRQQELADRAATARAQPKPAAPPRSPSSGPKTTVVPTPTAPARPNAIAPSVTQAGPGATTTLVTKRPAPPPYQQPGLPKVATGATMVDSKTLLPKRGAQAAGRASPAASAPAPVPRP